MGIFSVKSKRHPTTFQEQSAPACTSQLNLQELSQQCTCQPQKIWISNDQNPNTSYWYSPPPPQGWQASQQTAFRSQNYILSPPLPQEGYKTSSAMSRLNVGFDSKYIAEDVPAYTQDARLLNTGSAALQFQERQYLNQGAALHEMISSKFNTVITLIDGENFSGDEKELVVYAPPQLGWQQEGLESGYVDRNLFKGKSKGVANNETAPTPVSTNYFAKVNLYANSRLPRNLPQMKLYLPTFPLLCLAAQYSERVYTKPVGKERETHVDADWREGTKAMVIKSVPMDDIKTIVFAIRGTRTFMDWAVNFNSAPISPEGVLDDPGNFCHAGFLTVAKNMIRPVAARLRQLLAEDPCRSQYSLMITGHSSGGAVAALLYSHMLSTSREAESELNDLTTSFKRIHCITFGAPPVSLLPLATPADPRLKKSLFLAFVNEGDPVPRADKAYVKSLIDLYSTPAPGQACHDSVMPQMLQPLASHWAGRSSSSLTINKIRPSPKQTNSSPIPGQLPIWPVPDATLFNAGKLVLLRGVKRHDSRPDRKKRVQERMDEGVVAQMISDDLLINVIWGDPMCHMMKLYARRIEILATNAVTGRS